MYSGDELYSDDITSGILTGRRQCRNCGRGSRHLTDGWCPDCVHVPKIIEAAMAEGKKRAVKAARQLKRETAALLRREADRLEREAERD